MALVEARHLPRHVAIVMDGNGRWAESRGLPRSAGHRQGSTAVRSTVRACRRLGIGALTLFAFSEQNWGRPEDEIEALMALLHEYLVSEREEILTNGIQLRAIGDLERLPRHVQAVLEPLARISADNDAMVLTLALSYGGREEIVAAARALCESVARGDVRHDDISVESFAKRIPSVSVGDADLMIRTGGEVRVSNFLLWGIAYAELHFTSTLWPDFTTEDLYRAIAAYQARERRFGLTGAQLRTSPANGTEPTTTLVQDAASARR